MKKVLGVIMLIAAGVMVAASSSPDYMKVDENVDDRIAFIYWSGEGTGAWTKFEIYYDTEAGTFEGKWWYDDDHSGWIEGAATAEISGGVQGKGRFGGDYGGAWQGTFYFRGACFGKTWAKSDPPGDGEFYGL